MKTPIIDFVGEYCKKEAQRLHMPGHKGKGLFGFEKYDITEIKGADSLFEASGIIHESEKNASEIFGCNTFYSTEGSSLCIRAMLYLAVMGKTDPLILAGRNSHKTFLSAAALLGFDVQWLYPNEKSGFLSCNISAEDVEREILRLHKKPDAVYLTSPDYLGNVLDVKEISKVCRKHGVLLLVDNAHGAYLKFLPSSLHPMDNGADMCCDSAHKTLPCLTGGAYLHISKNADLRLAENAKEALSLFASTSPSYLILQSLDMMNKYISDGYKAVLEKYIGRLGELRKSLEKNGFEMISKEPLKITVNAKKYGYTGYELGKLLEENGVFPEFYDNDFLVLMFTPQIEDLEKIKSILLSVPKRDEIKVSCPSLVKPLVKMTVREATMSEKELIAVDNALGRILASPSVSCPPAVPVAICGEVIDEKIINAFLYYGVEKCFVVKQNGKI